MGNNIWLDKITQKPVHRHAERYKNECMYLVPGQLGTLRCEFNNHWINDTSINMNSRSKRGTGVFFLAIVLACLSSGVYSAPESAPKVASSRTDLKDAPIVIQTQVQDYDLPSMQDFQACEQTRQDCLTLCKTKHDIEKCESKCPTCPILIHHDVLVQGVNDTVYQEPGQANRNTTNIIHLKNEIRNVIDNTNEITARNENNIHVHQNISTTGGKYGLGYNEKGPCCHVVRPSRKCTDGANCRKKRQTLCGNHCKARTMYAKPVQRCVNDEDGGEDCRTVLKYEPYTHAHQKPRCYYAATWPYVSCPRQRGAVAGGSQVCQRCLSISYGHILRYGQPWECERCFNTISAPPMQSWYGSPYQFYPQVYGMPPPPPHSQHRPRPDDFYNSEEGWKVEDVKCRLADGTISTDCLEDSQDVDAAEKEYFEASGAGETNNEAYAYDDYDTSNDIEVNTGRQRRSHSNIFRRSRYSTRN